MDGGRNKSAVKFTAQKAQNGEWNEFTDEMRNFTKLHAIEESNSKVAREITLDYKVIVVSSDMERAPKGSAMEEGRVVKFKMICTWNLNEQNDKEGRHNLIMTIVLVIIIKQNRVWTIPWATSLFCTREIRMKLDMNRYIQTSASLSSFLHFVNLISQQINIFLLN